MVHSEATTIEHYLDSLPSERREMVDALRNIILDHLPQGYEEAMNWGMISYQVPLEVSGPTYNGQPLLYAALSSQKHHVSLYLMGVYSSPALAEGFEAAWLEGDNRLDRGKSCVRIRHAREIREVAVAKAIGAFTMEEYLEVYRASRNR
ncbi:DUF1801 domain-containing protein [Pontimonas sp.]|nr:DUF1801 domain-containing protein [Pontimonas sp.]